jgi:uncharacterized protein YyaL (SSP411 family)
MKAADKEWGGFGKAPKFPQTFTIQYLLRYHYIEEKRFNPSASSKTSTSATEADLENTALHQALLSLDK